MRACVRARFAASRFHAAGRLATPSGWPDSRVHADSPGGRAATRSWARFAPCGVLIRAGTCDGEPPRCANRHSAIAFAGGARIGQNYARITGRGGTLVLCRGVFFYVLDQRQATWASTGKSWGLCTCLCSRRAVFLARMPEEDVDPAASCGRRHDPPTVETRPPRAVKRDAAAAR